MVKARDDLACGLPAAHGTPPVEWRLSNGLVPYEQALAVMDARVETIVRGEAPPEPARTRPTCSTRASRSIAAAAAGNSPITGPASAWPT